MTISELRKRSNAFVQQLDNIIKGIVDDNTELEDLNKLQLDAGKDAKDKPIKPDYAPSYAQWKRATYPNAYKGHVNLFLEGDLYENIAIRYAPQAYSLYSNVPYMSKLIDKYGSNTLFGIAPSNEKEAQQITSRELSKQYKQKVL